MRRHLLSTLAIISVLQFGLTAIATDAKQKNSSDAAAVKHVGTADDSNASERDPQSNVRKNAVAHHEETDETESVHGHPSTGPNGKTSWTR